MRLKKKEIVKLLPTVSQIKRDLKVKQKQIARLSKEVFDLQETLLELDGIFLHEGFPMRVANYQSDIELQSAYAESTRYAYATKVHGYKNVTLYTINIYKGTSKEDDGMPVEGEHTQYASLRLMKSWVAYGKLTNGKRKRVPRRSTNV